MYVIVAQWNTALQQKQEEDQLAPILSICTLDKLATDAQPTVMQAGA
jgi:hypothetical protein